MEQHSSREASPDSELSIDSAPSSTCEDFSDFEKEKDRSLSPHFTAPTNAEEFENLVLSKRKKVANKPLARGASFNFVETFFLSLDNSRIADTTSCCFSPTRPPWICEESSGKSFLAIRSRQGLPTESCLQSMSIVDILGFQFQAAIFFSRLTKRAAKHSPIQRTSNSLR